MNSIENKIKLWNTCTQTGLFNNVNPAFEPQIKKLFEENITRFNTNNNTDISVLNNFFLEEFKRNLNNLLGTNVDTMSALEKKQQEYRDLFQPQVPTPIDFGAEKDKPIEGDMEEILRDKQEERKQEMSRILGQQPLPLTNVNEPSNFTLPSIGNNNTIFSFPPNNQQQNIQNLQTYSNSTQNQNSNQIIKILEKQSIILMKLLESQVKIIELLQKK
jgi:hypothetical protein